MGLWGNVWGKNDYSRDFYCFIKNKLLINFSQPFGEEIVVDAINVVILGDHV